MTGYTFRVEWSIDAVGLDLTREQLAQGATKDLPDLLVEHNAVAVGPWSWSVALSDDGERSWLVAECDAEPWIDPRRDVDRASA